MSELVAGELVYFHRYETGEYVQYDAIVRVCDPGTIPELNLSWFNADGGETPANNVKNIEDPSLGATEDYWRGRYGNVARAKLLAIGNSYLDTTRVERGGMVLFRNWGGAPYWQDIYLAVVVATLGSPADPNPRINLRYVSDSGEYTFESGVSCLERFDGENDAEGNSIWTNIPPGIID